MVWLWIGVAGAAGALGRFWLGGWVGRRAGDRLPWGTLAVNLAGSLLLGVLTGLLLGRAALTPVAKTVLGTGFLGAFTTFSTWQVELFRTYQGGARRAAWAYLALSTGLGLLTAWAGILLGWRL